MINCRSASSSLGTQLKPVSKATSPLREHFLKHFTPPLPKLNSLMEIYANGICQHFFLGLHATARHFYRAGLWERGKEHDWTPEPTLIHLCQSLLWLPRLQGSVAKTFRAHLHDNKDLIKRTDFQGSSALHSVALSPRSPYCKQTLDKLRGPLVNSVFISLGKLALLAMGDNYIREQESDFFTLENREMGKVL